jgi:transcriptional regulator NrdR family protein
MAGKAVTDRTTGLPCPQCRRVESRVTETRAATVGEHQALRRRRTCLGCAHRWWTYELAEEAVAPLHSGGARGELRLALAVISKLRQVIVTYDRRGKPESTEGDG